MLAVFPIMHLFGLYARKGEQILANLYPCLGIIVVVPRGPPATAREVWNSGSLICRSMGPKIFAHIGKDRTTYGRLLPLGGIMSHMA